MTSRPARDAEQGTMDAVRVGSRVDDELDDVGGAVAAVLANGAALLSGVMGRDACDMLRREASRRIAEVTAALCARGIDPRSDECAPFSYAEAASRCPGRLDVRFQRGSCVEAVVENKGCAVAQLCEKALGKCSRCARATKCLHQRGGQPWPAVEGRDTGQDRAIAANCGQPWHVPCQLTQDVCVRVRISNHSAQAPCMLMRLPILCLLTTCVRPP